MRTRSLLCKLRQIHNHLPQTRPLRTLAPNPRVAESSGTRWESPNDYLRNVSMIGSVRCMGIGSHKEGNRSGQHGVHYPNAKPDGSPEKQEADARAQFLVKAKAESASNVDGAQERPAGEAATELQFGVKDGKSTDEAIGHASEELFNRSSINGAVVGNVPSAGANAIENEGDIPQFSKEQQETGDETLDKAQKSYEKATSGFGTIGDKNVQAKA